MSSQAINEWIAKNGVKVIAQGARTYTESQMRHKVRGVDAPTQNDRINERHSHTRRDGTILVVNGLGERIS